MRSGIDGMVRRLTVTSSPIWPSPRVAPRTKRPFSYVRLIASPSIFGSSTNATGAPLSRRLSTSAAHLTIASSVVTFSSEPIGVRCSTFWNFDEAGAPTRWVGESGVTSSGCFSSSATSSSYARSYVASSTEGSSSTWYSCSQVASCLRSSIARAASEDGKQLLRGVDDHVRIGERRSGVDPAPGDADRVQAAGLRGLHVVRRVADVRRLVGACTQPLEPEQQWLRLGLVALGLVATDDRVDVVGDRQPREREIDGRTALRRHEPERAALLLER